MQKRFPSLSLYCSTIRKRLRENKYKYRKPKIIQKLTDAQKYTRYNFSHNMLINYSSEFNKIIFSDERRLCNDPDNRC